MSSNKKLTIGLFGFGVVGEGLYRVLQQTASLNAVIKKVCIKDLNKFRNAPLSLFTTDKNVLLNDPEINVIVEVINESDAAFEIVRTALVNGKEVISASKKMLAEHLEELLNLQKETGLSLLYEASACASIPVIRNLEEYYDNDLLHGIRAIVNGSTNYILSRMSEAGLGFKEALQEAQELGFAESDPTLDVDGWDAANKWVILLLHAYGIISKTEDLLFNGIRHIRSEDSAFGKERELEIKLVGQAKKLKNGNIASLVLPQFVGKTDPLHFVRNEYNGVVLESSFADQQFFYGKGAGSFPTASAVLSDISALRYGYKYEYKKLYSKEAISLTNNYFLKVYISFDDWKNIPNEKFEWVEELNEESSRKFVVAVIHSSELLNEQWWKENGNSLILFPEPIIEDVETWELNKRSLELVDSLA